MHRAHPCHTSTSINQGPDHEHQDHRRHRLPVIATTAWAGEKDAKCGAGSCGKKETSGKEHSCGKKDEAGKKEASCSKKDGGCAKKDASCSKK